MTSAIFNEVSRLAISQGQIIGLSQRIGCLQRGYATLSVDSRPPIALYGLAGTYASALYTAAVKSSSLEATSSNLSALKQLLQDDKALGKILTAPTLSSADKSQIVQELGKKVGLGQKSSSASGLLQTLADNNRLGILSNICDDFEALIRAAHGETEMTVISAQKIDSKSLQRLEQAISKSEYSQGKKLRVLTKVKPEIQGGLVVEVGDRTIDLSVSSKLAKMNKLLSDSV